MTAHTSTDPFRNYDRWLEEPYQRQQDMEAECPNCHESISKNDEECPHCGEYVGEHEPDPDSMPGGYDNPTDYDEFGSPYGRHGAITSKFHILGADGQELPGEVDHSRVDQMSQAQEGAHQRLVNYAVEKINDAITGGGAVDESLLQNLQLDIVNQFGIDAQEAQTIVDTAMRQSQNQDQTLDTLQPAPVEQSANPQTTGVGQGPEPVPVANGAFAKTARGLVGTVTDSWVDIYDEQWVEVTDPSGFRESVYASEVERVDQKTAAVPETEVDEIVTFLRETEPKSVTAAEVKARITNLKLAQQEIRRLIANNKVSDNARLALDKINDDAAVELMNLTDVMPGLAPKSEVSDMMWDMAEHQAPTLYGVDELPYIEDIEPEYTSEAIDAAIPEEAEVFTADHDDVPESALLSMAASHIDTITAGHTAEVRAQHRARFVEAVKTAAANVTREPETTKVASEEEPLANYDGPAEAIFSWPGQ